VSEDTQAALIKAVSPRHKPRILYHYTSGPGLIGILESRSIWATNIRFLNDSTEYRFALSLVGRLIQERPNGIPSGFDRALNTVLEERLKIDEQAEVYVSSFTENADQLSQWRAYCPPTGGYAVGFCSKSLIQPTRSNPDYFLAHCVYDPSSQEELFGELVEGFTLFAEDRVRSGLSQDRVFRESFKLLGRLLRLIAPTLKESEFRRGTGMASRSIAGHVRTPFALSPRSVYVGPLSRTFFSQQSRTFAYRPTRDRPDATS
jgi:hypothetical protein